MSAYVLLIASDRVRGLEMIGRRAVSFFGPQPGGMLAKAKMALGEGATHRSAPALTLDPGVPYRK